MIVRDIPDSDRRDAISPYGYPGAETPGPVDPAAVDWSPTGLVSIFIRERALGEPAFTDATVRGALQIADPSQSRKRRMSDRQQIRRNRRDGYDVVSAPGPAASSEERRGFERAYRETMVRAEASERYMFSSEYFERVLGSDRTWLFSVLASDGDYAAGSIAALSDGCLHYYLSGTVDDHLRASPMKNIVSEMCDFAAERELPVNLGGGLEPGDRLEEFKRGFANAEAPFRTDEIVCDRAAYEELSAGADADADLFPRYRA